MSSYVSQNIFYRCYSVFIYDDLDWKQTIHRRQDKNVQDVCTMGYRPAVKKRELMTPTRNGAAAHRNEDEPKLGVKENIP